MSSQSFSLLTIGDGVRRTHTITGAGSLPDLLSDRNHPDTPGRAG